MVSVSYTHLDVYKRQDVILGRKLTAVKRIVIDVKNAGAEFYDQEVVVDKDHHYKSTWSDFK